MGIMTRISRLACLPRVSSLAARYASSKSTRSPRDLYDHLGQYIVGQNSAKRVLSVAVFNHYQRIAPLIAQEEEAASSSSSSKRGSPSYTDTSKSSTPPAYPEGRPFQRSAPPHPTEPDPSILPSEPDPTLTHELTAETRERDWARDGYFSSVSPPLSIPSPLSKALKRRKAANPEDKPETTSQMIDITGADGEVARRVRVRGPDIEEFIPQPAMAEPDTADNERVHKGDEPGRRVEIEKSNVLMIGPTGTGKTLMTRTLARILNVPFASCDATTYTSAGYVGEDVENCILRLLQAADYDVAKAEMGIIHLDEVDKLARRGAGDGFATWGGGRDVGGEGVQQAFLRLMEGTLVTIQAKPPPVSSSASGSSKNDPLGDGWASDSSLKTGFGGSGPKKGVRDGLPGYGGSGSGGSGKAETFVVDTSNILFICSGAFVGLENLVNARLGKGSMGFGAKLPAPPPDNDSNGPPNPNPTALKGLSTPDLTQYGLIPEFLGRLPIISTLHPLSVPDLVRILTEPRNALIKQYQAIFESYGSELRFTRRAIEAIAGEGLTRGGGARGLRGVLEEVLGDAMFEVPGSGVRYCLITEGVVKKEAEALYFSRGQRFVFEQRASDEDGDVPDEWDETEEVRARATG